MKLSNLRRAVVQVLLVAVGVAAVLTSGAPAQSLGDVAKQEEARRKGATAAARGGKVYTNDDLRGAPAPAATSPQPSTSAPSSTAPAAPAAGAKPDAAKPDAAKPEGNAKPGDSTPKADGKSADPKGDEASWRKRRQTIQEALDRAKTFAEALQSRINGLTADFSARDDPAQRSAVAADRQKALTELERVKKEIAQHAKALDDLQEEARKSGVPAGWLR